MACAEVRKKESTAKLNYDEELGLIIAEHLISETKEPQKKWTYVTDGDFEGFKWVNGKWLSNWPGVDSSVSEIPHDFAIDIHPLTMKRWHHQPSLTLMAYTVEQQK